MALLTQPFNALQFDPEMGSSALPLGLKQPVRAIESQLKGARENNNNGFLEFTVEILDGPNKGQTGAIRFNIYNNNGDAARIAHNQLAAMALCAGVPHFNDSQQLHNMPFLVDVTAQKVKAGQEDKGYTEVSAFYNVAGQKPLRGGGFSEAPGGGQQQQNNQQQNNGGNQQQQAPDQNQQQQQSNQGQQTNQQQGNGGGWNNNNGGNQGNQQQQQAPANTGGNAGWNTGNNGGNQQQGNAGNGGNAGGAAPWNK